MSDYQVPTPNWKDPIIARFLRVAAGGWVPARWFQPNLPAPAERSATNAAPDLEIVSHCWRYAHLLIYQLSSLALFPPREVTVTMTVYYCPEDTATGRLLEAFARREVPGVTWNWRALPRQALFRRAIGRNQAALASRADWLWFTDCDLMFRDGCLDGLGRALQGRRDALVYPRTEYCTGLLDPAHPLLNADPLANRLVDIPEPLFTPRQRSRATGPLQITHGDVARRCGYCDCLAFYQRPSETWCKAHEDRAFRWLLRTQGTPLDFPGPWRIRHVAKGRYTGGRLNTGLRSWIRRIASRLKES